MPFISELLLNNREPVYIQVVRYFKTLLATGKLEPGEPIPSRRELANLMKINPTTSQKVYKELEDQGLITTERNSKSVVTMNVELIKGLKLELIQEALDHFMESIAMVEVEEKELLQLVSDKYKIIRGEI